MQSALLLLLLAAALAAAAMDRRGPTKATTTTTTTKATTTKVTTKVTTTTKATTTKSTTKAATTKAATTKAPTTTTTKATTTKITTKAATTKTSASTTKAATTKAATTKATTTTTTTTAATLGRVTDPMRLLTLAEDFGYYVHQLPAAAFCPTSAEGVALVVRWAADTGSRLTVRGNGHSTMGQSQAVPGGAVLDSSCLSSIVVDAARKRVVAGAGALWSQVTVAAAEAGLHPYVTPDASALSVGGSLSIGGAGILSPIRGMLVHNVLELVVVTGAGDIVHCSPTSHADLFNTVLGGQGQAAVIVSATFPLEAERGTVSEFMFFFNDHNTFIDALVNQPMALRFEGAGGTCYSNTDVGLTNIQPVINALVNASCSGCLDSFFSKLAHKHIYVITTMDLDGDYVIPPGVLVVPVYVNKTFTAYALQEEAALNGLRFNPPFFLYQPRANLHVIGPIDTPPQLFALSAWTGQMEAMQEANPLIAINYGVIRVGSAAQSASSNNPVVGLPANSTIVLDANFLVGIQFADPVKDLSPWAATTATLSAFTQGFQGLLQYVPEAKLCPWNIRPETIPGYGWARHYGSKYAALAQAKATYDPAGVLGAGPAVFA